MRIPTQSGASAAAGVAGQGAGACFRGSGVDRDWGDEMHQKSAPSESRATAAAGEGRPRPQRRRPRAATRGRHGERASGVRPALPVQCTRPSTAPRSASLRPAAPPLTAGSLSPGRGAAEGRSGRALRLAGPREPSRRQNFCVQPSGSPIPGAFAFAPPPPSSPLSPTRGTGRVPGSRLVHSEAEDYIYMQTVSLSPDCPLRRRHGRLVFHITVSTLHLPFRLPPGICGRS